MVRLVNVFHNALSPGPARPDVNVLQVRQFSPGDAISTPDHFPQVLFVLGAAISIVDGLR